MYLIKQSSTSRPLLFYMTSNSDHISPATGLTVTVKISKNGAIGATPSGTVTEIDSTNMPGWYAVAGNATDTNTLGILLLHAIATGADPTDAQYEVQALDPHSTSAPSTYLDAISIADVTSDTDARSTLPKMLRALFNRHFNKVTATASQMQVFNDGGSATQTLAVSDDGTTATKGKSA